MLTPSHMGPTSCWRRPVQQRFIHRDIHWLYVERLGLQKYCHARASQGHREAMLPSPAKRRPAFGRQLCDQLLMALLDARDLARASGLVRALCVGTRVGTGTQRAFAHKSHTLARYVFGPARVACVSVLLRFLIVASLSRFGFRLLLRATLALQCWWPCVSALFYVLTARSTQLYPTCTFKGPGTLQGCTRPAFQFFW